MPVVASTQIIADQYEIVVWNGETATGSWADVARYTDITAQAFGTGTVTFDGSNDGSHAAALNDVNGTPISLAATTNAMSVVKEHPFWIRPVVTGGTATIIMLASGNR